jgi:homopolymeric O-antigen transport system permease protein
VTQDSRTSQQTWQLLQRPSRPLSIALDAIVGVAAHLAAYWLRFHQDELLGTFLRTALSTAPYVVAAQLALLAICRAYDARPRRSWLFRVVAGCLLGSAASSTLVAFTVGFEGVSRAAFAADALLLTILALSWRAIWVVNARAETRARSTSPDGELVDRAAELTTLTGVVRSLYSYRELLKNLVLKDLKLKYRGSVFGFLWSLANPLLMVVVYSLAFTVLLRVQSQGFVFSLLLGLLSWTFFAGAASMSTGAIVENSGLLKSVLLPRAILPIGTVLFNLVQFALTASVFLPVLMIWYRVPPSLPILTFPVFLALQVVFTTGVALLLATATAFFRDVRHLLEVTLNVLFWSTPIVYQINQIPEQYRFLILLSPMSPYVVAYQQMFLYRSWPDATVWSMALAHALGAFVSGVLLFFAFEDRFMEQL